MSFAGATGFPVLAGPKPSERPLSLWRLIRAASTNVIAAIPASAYRQPISELHIGDRHVFLVNDPSGVKQVLLDNVANYPKAPQPTTFLAAAFGDGLLTSDGEKWRSHRRIMAPSFDSRSIASYAPAMAEVIADWRDNWNRSAPGRIVDISEEMTELTLRIISRTMFSSDGDALCRMIGETLRRGTEAMAFPAAQLLPVIGPIWRRWRIENIHRTFSALDAGIYDLIARRAGKPQRQPPDLLDRLIAASDAETGRGMTTQEVRDEVVIIFLAGHETTAVAMTFAWYLLGLHPEAETKLHEELDRVLGGRTPGYDDIDKLVYARMVIEESMRLYPPAPGTATRMAKESDTLCGRQVPAGSFVVVSPWILHRHETLWQEPERFIPERFAPGQNHPRFAYLPFGGGPRICIGASLAMTEAILILAMVAQRFRLQLVPDQKIDLRLRVTLRPTNGIGVRIEPRRGLSSAGSD